MLQEIPQTQIHFDMENFEKCDSIIQKLLTKTDDSWMIKQLLELRDLIRNAPTVTYIPYSPAGPYTIQWDFPQPTLING